MVADGNRLVVFGSQLVGVLVVIVGLLTQQSELRSPRPVGNKTQVSAKPDLKGDQFARLWEDPLENLPTFQITPPDQPPAAATTARAPATSSTHPLAQDEASTTEVPPLATNKPLTESSNPSDNPPPAEGPLPADDPTRSLTSKDTTTNLREVGVPPSSPTPPLIARGEQSQRKIIVSTKSADESQERLLIWNILDARPLSEARELRLRTRYAIVSALMTAGYLPVRQSVLLPLFLDPPDGALDQPKPPPFGYYESFAASGARTSIRQISLIWTPKQAAITQDIISAIQKQISQQENPPGKLFVRFLHHGSSEDLVAYAASPIPLPEATTSFVRATIPLKYLEAVPASSASSPPALRPIRPDDQLAQGLVSELLLRIPELHRRGKHPRIVIFTESDTNYSRAITAELTEQLQQRAPSTAVEVYSYLRALDGRPEEGRSAAELEGTSTEDVAASLLQGKAISEHSFGTSQFDYLRRLSLYLDKKRPDGKGEIFAAGVLGTDIYDKMLVLQAIRPRLPGAIFFTTDLDALYLERQNQPFTRNLIVASADNLNPNDAVNATASRWKLPPMRDSYQTVLAKHIWAILAAGTGKINPESLEFRSPPCLVEIVAGKSIDLHPTLKSVAGGSSKVLRYLPIWSGVIFLVALGNGFVILWAISTRGTDKNQPASAAMHPLARRITYSEVAVAGAAMLVLLGLLLKGEGLVFGEPLSLGASIWPSVMIRLLAFIVAVLLLLIASYAFVTQAPGWRNQLENALPAHLRLPLAGTLPKELLRLSRFLFTEKEERCPDQTFKQLLEDMFDRKRRTQRIIAASTLYFLISAALFILWTPVVPARGAASFLIEKFVLAFGVALYIIHLIYCLDLHLSALTLLRILRSFYSPAVQYVTDAKIDARQMLTAVSALTAIIGKTLLYPLTVLILIILSRLRIFDAWAMTPSLTITFAGGAILLISASLTLWRAGSQLKNDVIAAQAKKRPLGAREKEQILEIDAGVFAAWYQQPIFAAILSAAAVFGSLSVAGPLTRMFLGSS